MEFRTVEGHLISDALKTYETRDGRKVWLMHFLLIEDRQNNNIISHELCGIMKDIYSIDGDMYFRWGCNGKFNNLTEEHPFDLMRPWKEKEEVIDKDGWIEWKGGECPVDGDTLVEVKFKNDCVSSKKAKSYSWDWWNRNGISGDIVAYRVIEKEKEKKEVYDLNEGWCVWYKIEEYVNRFWKDNEIYYTKEDALKGAELWGYDLLGITPASATRCYEGENLEGDYYNK